MSRKGPAPTGRAVLYLHGYVDYFFQAELAERYLEHGSDVTDVAVPGGLHDLVLSSKTVRDQVYDELFTWLDSRR